MVGTSNLRIPGLPGSRKAPSHWGSRRSRTMSMTGTVYPLDSARMLSQDYHLYCIHLYIVFSFVIYTHIYIQLYTYSIIFIDFRWNQNWTSDCNQCLFFDSPWQYGQNRFGLVSTKTVCGLVCSSPKWGMTAHGPHCFVNLQSPCLMASELSPVPPKKTVKSCEILILADKMCFLGAEVSNWWNVNF